MKKGDEKELERNLRLEKVVASKQLSLAVEMDEAKLEMNQLPNGSGWPWRQTKKESKTREVVATNTVHVGPGDRGRKKSKQKEWI